jgi:transcriptional regulator with XRE-family HTH domain
MSARSPNQTDVYIGKRIRMMRLARGLSQTDVAGRLGITFQQIQKYEKGANRVGAGRLQEMANLLGVTPAFFFEDGPRLKPGKSGEAPETTELLANKYNLALAQAYNRIRSRNVRRNVLELVEGLADSY